MTSMYMKGKNIFPPTHSPNCFLSIAPRSVPKFMKRMKVPDYKEKSVFGVPLIIHVQRCGFPLPLCLQQAHSHLRTHCLDQVREQKRIYKSLYHVYIFIYVHIHSANQKLNVTKYIYSSTSMP